MDAIRVLCVSQLQIRFDVPLVHCYGILGIVLVELVLSVQLVDFVGRRAFGAGEGPNHVINKIHF